MYEQPWNGDQSMRSQKELTAPTLDILAKLIKPYLDDGWGKEVEEMKVQGKYVVVLFKEFEPDIDKHR